MLNSTITRLLSVSLLFIVIISSGYALSVNKNTEDTPLKTTTALSQQASETLIESDEITDTPIVKLASLSIATDYPAVSDSELTTQLGVDVEQRLVSAQKFAAAQKFDEALELLEVTPLSEQEAYSVNYLKAQILSWAGDHNKAEQAFTQLRKQYPQDADIAVSFGYLHLYQNKFDEAERLFSQVLERFPDYQDAKLGLKRATAIQ